MLMILFRLSNLHRQKATTTSRAWIVFRPPECDSARPIKVGKKEQVATEKVQFSWGHCGLRSLKAWWSQEWIWEDEITLSEGKMLPSGASGEKKKKKNIMLVVCFICSGISAAGSVLQTSSCLFVVRRCYHSASLTLNKQAEKVHFTVVCPQEEYH